MEGRLLDGQGQPIADGWIEAWTPAAVPAEQAVGAALPGFRRAATDAAGRYRLWLTPVAEQPAAFITVFARGLLQHQHSAVFLADGDLAASALLGQVPPERRTSLLARALAPWHYHWDIRLQGRADEAAAGETVFFDYCERPCHAHRLTA